MGYGPSVAYTAEQTNTAHTERWVAKVDQSRAQKVVYSEENDSIGRIRDRINNQHTPAGPIRQRLGGKSARHTCTTHCVAERARARAYIYSDRASDAEPMRNRSAIYVRTKRAYTRIKSHRNTNRKTLQRPIGYGASKAIHPGLYRFHTSVEKKRIE